MSAAEDTARTRELVLERIREALKSWRTSAWPSGVSTSAGSSIPSIAPRSSSIAR